jgi:hypothetical protein
MYAMNASSKPVIKLIFPENAGQGNLKRPDTLATQFRVSATFIRIFTDFQPL